LELVPQGISWNPGGTVFANAKSDFKGSDIPRNQIQRHLCIGSGNAGNIFFRK
jgi:hypothetical protein